MPMWISQEDADGKKEWVKLEKLPKDLLSLIQWQSRVYHIVVAGDDDAPILGWKGWKTDDNCYMMRSV